MVRLSNGYAMMVTKNRLNIVYIIHIIYINEILSNKNNNNKSVLNNFKNFSMNNIEIFIQFSRQIVRNNKKMINE